MRSSAFRCPICGGFEVAKIGKPQISSEAIEFIRADYDVVQCRTCKFYFVHPEISFSAGEWESLYGSEYFEELVPWWARKRGKEQERQLDELEKHSGRSINTFLDIGCGEGRVLVEAVERGWRPYGIDINDNRVWAAKDDRVTFAKGTVFEVPFPDGFFDAIYMESVLEHIVSPMAHLHVISRILRKGGVLHIGTPNEDCLFNDTKQLIFRLAGRGHLSARLSPFKPPYHVTGFTRESLTKTLAKSGFEIVSLRNFAGEYEWRKYRFLTRPFLIHFLLLPVHLIAIPLEKRVYFAVLARRSD